MVNANMTLFFSNLHKFIFLRDVILHRLLAVRADQVIRRREEIGCILGITWWWWRNADVFELVLVCPSTSRDIPHVVYIKYHVATTSAGCPSRRKISLGGRKKRFFLIGWGVDIHWIPAPRFLTLNFHLSPWSFIPLLPCLLSSAPLLRPSDWTDVLRALSRPTRTLLDSPSNLHWFNQLTSMETASTPL